MSGGHNPYAVNGYGGLRQSSESNPYAPTNASNTTPSSRYADPYVNRQQNASSASVNSFGSHERRRRSNPYDRGGRESPGPVPTARISSSGGAGAGEYGGLPRPRYGDSAPPPRHEHSHSAEAQGNSGHEQRQNRLAPRERDRMYAGADGREGGDLRATGAPPATTRSKASISSINEPPSTQAYSHPPYAVSDKPIRYRSPRRPAKSMEEILRHIQTNWKVMEGDECVPVQIALKLMDPSSLGLADKEEDFAETHVDLQRSLKAVVNEHYADFNSAVGTYHKIQNAIRGSQGRVKHLKDDMKQTEMGMLSTKPELRGLAEQSGRLDEMIALLNSIEALETVPAKLEEKISDKKFLGAVDLLVESLQGIMRSELDGIGAVSDLRSYFTNQENTLLDILVEELHDHLYLRSPYCKDRWKSRNGVDDDKDATASFTLSAGNMWDRPFMHYLSSAELATPMVEDASKNPETNTFYYIHMILEALNKLGQLGEAISRLEHRMPIELNRVVEKSTNEVDSRYLAPARTQPELANRHARIPRITEGQSHVLSDFLWTLYAKFEAIAEGHRVLHEVVTGIATREKLSRPEKLTGGFKELWKLYQMEMRSLLHDYLAADAELSIRSGMMTTTGSDVFARHQRDKNKRMFKLSEMDRSEAMKAEQDELDEILKSSVPGLVSKSRDRGGPEMTSDRNAFDGSAVGRKLLIEPGVFNMTILLPPSLAFLQRLKDVVPATAHIPMSTLTSFLDDFLVNVFHPQLEEAVSDLCTQSMIDMEAFTEDAHWSKHSARPLFKGTISFMTLVRLFSGMLASIPQDQMFTQLIIDQLVRYYDKCFGFYKTLVSRVASATATQSAGALSLKAAASLAEAGEVRDVALELLAPPSTADHGTTRSTLITKEVQALLVATKANPVSAYDIISDPKSVHQLALLHNSMQYLHAALAQIRQIEPSTSSARSQARNGPHQPSSRRWTLIPSLRGTSGAASQNGAAHPVFIPLTSETVVAFDRILAAFEALGQTSLLTLHIDIRCGIIHQISSAMRGPEPAHSTPPTDNRESPGPALDSGLYPYILSSPPSSPSPFLLELINDLIAVDAKIAAYLGSSERRFIFAGLAQLADRYFVAVADLIGVMNKNGAERARIDIMVLQQNLRVILARSCARSLHEKSDAGVDDKGVSHVPTSATATGLGISTEPSASVYGDGEGSTSGLLTSSSSYFELFLRGPGAILEFVKDCKSQKNEIGFTYDELRTLVELWFSANLRCEDREEAVKARKQSQDMLLALGEIMWDS